MQQEFQQQRKTEGDPEPDAKDITLLSTQHPSAFSKWKKNLKVILPLLILGLGLVLAFFIYKTGPETSKKPPVNIRPLVTTQKVHPSSESVMLRAMGTVIPARQMQLKARVSGEIVSIRAEFIEGGMFKKGEDLFQIDPEDYKLAVAQKQSQVVNARYKLKLEQGRQDVAKREWQLLNKETEAKPLDIELSLRKPHLEKAEADLAAAEANLKQANLNLERTKVRAPFNAIIIEKNVEQGSQISSQDQLAELAGTDAYWVQASIPVDRLGWITVPRKPGDAASTVRILYGEGVERIGNVIKLLGDLEEDGRMARVLVLVKDPLYLKTPETNKPPLLLGEYVKVEIQGRRLENVFSIPRTALRDNGKVWIVDDDDKLIIRNVDVLWRDIQTVLLKDGVQAGARIIVSDLAAPVNGMSVRVETASDEPGGGKQ